MTCNQQAITRAKIEKKKKNKPENPTICVQLSKEAATFLPGKVSSRTWPGGLALWDRACSSPRAHPASSTHTIIAHKKFKTRHKRWQLLFFQLVYFCTETTWIGGDIASPRCQCNNLNHLESFLNWDVYSAIKQAHSNPCWEGKLERETSSQAVTEKAQNLSSKYSTKNVTLQSPKYLAILCSSKIKLHSKNLMSIPSILKCWVKFHFLKMVVQKRTGLWKKKHPQNMNFKSFNYSFLRGNKNQVWI